VRQRGKETFKLKLTNKNYKYYNPSNGSLNKGFCWVIDESHARNNRRTVERRVFYSVRGEMLHAGRVSGQSQ
jgi:hypothetical protein